MFALGHLSKFILRSGVTVRFVEADNLLVWDDTTESLLIVRPLHEKRTVENSSDYERFHAEAPAKCVQVEWFKAPKRGLIDLGLIKLIHYYIPKTFNSVKQDKEYKHYFGDFGDGDKRSGLEWLPSLAYDPKRQAYYIQRREGNAWTVDDYIRG